MFSFTSQEDFCLSPTLPLLLKRSLFLATSDLASDFVTFQVPWGKTRLGVRVAGRNGVWEGLPPNSGRFSGLGWVGGDQGSRGPWKALTSVIPGASSHTRQDPQVQGQAAQVQGQVASVPILLLGYLWTNAGDRGPPYSHTPWHCVSSTTAGQPWVEGNPEPRQADLQPSVTGQFLQTLSEVPIKHAEERTERK